MKIDSTTCRERHDRTEGVVVLSECARNDEGVLELGNVARTIRIALNSDAADPCLFSGGATNRHLPEGSVVMISFEHFAELMIVSLPRDCRSRGDDIPTAEQELAKRTGVVSTGF